LLTGNIHTKHNETGEGQERAFKSRSGQALKVSYRHAAVNHFEDRFRYMTKSSADMTDAQPPDLDCAGDTAAAFSRFATHS
jgi:hypothetical protein